MASDPPASGSEIDKPLRIVFMGTPALAAHILARLADAAGRGFAIVGVVTRPDQPRGRGLRLEPSEVGAVAERRGFPLLRPAKIRTTEFLAALRALDPDLLAVAAYGRILPDPVLAAARIMPLNVHASLLPRHRGASPVEGAILAGDGETGITIMRITSRMDAGPILLARAIPIAPDETQGTLKGKLAELGAAALLEALEKLRHGQLVETPQDENVATYTAPVSKADAVIDWSADAARIERMVRAYDPWPVARTRFGGDELLIWRAALDDSVAPGAPGATAAGGESVAAAGTIVRMKPDVAVQCGRGRVVLAEVQAAGRKRMGAAEFLRGRRGNPGERLG
ncbi:MAG TPA: methionyl-tRNA formyltransferase [Candidatus Binataceae bacterium]|nr:methionyl-tRNA formyltransferase [Candidatus Binataceae bacterium]